MAGLLPAGRPCAKETVFTAGTKLPSNSGRAGSPRREKISISVNGRKLACYASVTGHMEEAKLRLHAIDLDKNIRWLALDDEDLRPLWDWITDTR